MNYTTWRDICEYLHVNSGSINLSSIMIKQISYLCEFDSSFRASIHIATSYADIDYKLGRI